jgi:hypothetical protein
VKILEVQLREILVAPFSHKVREIKDDKVESILSGLKMHGFHQRGAFPAYKANGKWHAIGGNTTITALQKWQGKDSDFPIWIRQEAFNSDAEARSEAAIDNNVEPFSMAEWQAIFLEKQKELGTQEAVAAFYWKSQSFVSHCINLSAYGKEAQRQARREAREAAKAAKEAAKAARLVVTNNSKSPSESISEKSSSSRDHLSPSPASGSEGRTLHKAAPSSSLLTLDAGHGAVRESPREVASTAPTSFRSPEADEKAEIRAALRVLLGSFTKNSVSRKMRDEFLPVLWTGLDYFDSVESGRWNGEAPIAKQRRATLLRAKVLIDNRPMELPFIEEKQGGWRVLSGDGKILFIKARDCVAILDAGKVSA